MLESETAQDTTCGVCGERICFWNSAVSTFGFRRFEMASWWAHTEDRDYDHPAVPRRAMSDRTDLRPSEHFEHIHPPWGVEQVGWLGASGRVYGLRNEEGVRNEPGSFTPLYVERSEECQHSLIDQQSEALAAEALAAEEQAIRSGHQVGY